METLCTNNLFPKVENLKKKYKLQYFYGGPTKLFKFNFLGSDTNGSITVSKPIVFLKYLYLKELISFRINLYLLTIQISSQLQENVKTY